MTQKDKLLQLKARIGHLFGQGEEFARATDQFGEVGFHASVTPAGVVDLEMSLTDPDEAVCVIRAIQAARETWRRVNGRDT